MIDKNTLMQFTCINRYRKLLALNLKQVPLGEY